MMKPNPEDAPCSRRAFNAAGLAAGMALAVPALGAGMEDGAKLPEEEAMAKDGNADLSMVTYCGLCCDLCAERCRVPKQARQLRDSMRKEGWEYFGDQMPNYTAFWAFLNRTADSPGCPGCRAGGGMPTCEIRKCAKNRGQEVCSSCADYPCEKVRAIAARYPTLLADAARMKEIGVAAWLGEQRKRAATGFAYVDIRIEPGEEDAQPEA